jgi:hypothetical protein
MVFIVNDYIRAWIVGIFEPTETDKSFEFNVASELDVRPLKCQMN